MATPVGKSCGWCGEQIEDGDQGVTMPGAADGPTPFHQPCAVRMVVGGLNHQKRLCTCCGGALPPDPPDLSMRAAARVAAEYARLTSVRTFPFVEGPAPV